jgi:hypothetical protein
MSEGGNYFILARVDLCGTGGSSNTQIHSSVPEPITHAILRTRVLEIRNWVNLGYPGSRLNSVDNPIMTGSPR